MTEKIFKLSQFGQIYRLIKCYGEF